MTTQTGQQEIDSIRKAIKRVAPTVHVRRGRGTARWWIEVSGSADEWGNFTNREKLQLQELGILHGANFAVIGPDDRDRVAHKLGAY